MISYIQTNYGIVMFNRIWRGFIMKKIGLGIAILLFAIVISLCSSGMELLSVGIGIVGLFFSIIGFMEHK